MSTHQPPASGAARLTVVESDGCHFCEDAHRALAELAASYPLTVERVDARSDTGQRLMRVHGASMSPLVLLNGKFFSHGRLPRRKLQQTLSGRQATQHSRTV